jgi:NAD+ kinase
MKSIGVIANTSKPEAPAVLERLAAKSAALGLRVVSFGETAKLLPGCSIDDPVKISSNVDAVIAVGGDGTMIQAAHLVQNSRIPILGLNLGFLGFLTSAGVGELEHAIAQLATRNFTISERATIRATVKRDGATLGESRAINDVVIGWGQSSRIITFDVTIDGKPMTSYRCDGILVATPTGSTGHSLSAGGPIVHPETPALLLNVISPHALTARPVVLPQHHVIGITVVGSQKELLGSVDGQEQYKLRQGDQITVRISPDPARFIELPGSNYFAVLREKLNWRGSSGPR